jgi:hypothetical protein
VLAQVGEGLGVVPHELKLARIHNSVFRTML